MLKNFLANIESWKLTGLRIGTVGVMVAFSGFILFVIFKEIEPLEPYFRIIIYAGFVIAFFGMAVHLVILFKIFVKRIKW